ncbi:MAG: sensor histidine kinase [Novosphingobium sp.]|nr:sensor histidine kinase [Novosphingobium sp.]
MISSLRVRVVLAALLLALAAASVAGEVTRTISLGRLAARSVEDARLRQALLASEIARFRLLPRALADDRDLVAVTSSNSPQSLAALNRKLEILAREFGASAIYTVDRDGLAFGASNWRKADSFIGRNYRFRPYFHDAVRSGSGQQFALGTASRKPGLFLATRAAGNSVVVVKLEFDRIEAQWRAAQGITYVTDAQGVVLVTSRPDWRFAATGPIPPALRKTEEEVTGVSALRPMPFRRIGANLIVPAGVDDAYLQISTAADVKGWRLNLALPLDAVNANVRLAQGVGALIALLLAGITAGLAERARQRRQRTVLLETAVAERTAELRAQIQERAAAEARAATLREGLRQANRLATLGQVTASVAHETAQPVAAIRNYAAASAMLLDRGAVDEARANLDVIARLSDKIGAITAHLRGFARKGGHGGLDAVSVAEAIDGARLILKEQLSHVSFTAPALAKGLAVRAERVRLEQVLVILLQNAAEALVNTRDPTISLTVTQDADNVILKIADNGPGIAPDIAERLFTPFATNRTMGLGLGLVIAKDIVEEFSGSLLLEPAEVGACFRIVLPRAPA